MRLVISIHAPRTGSDPNIRYLKGVVNDFNPRSPHGERHCRAGSCHPSAGISIHAPRTGSDKTGARPEQEDTIFQSTLPARGATDKPHMRYTCLKKISIHAPRTGSDVVIAGVLAQVVFQSTLPARGATYIDKLVNSKEMISIHAPRTGSDRCRISHTSKRQLFQSTLPARGATLVSILKLAYNSFQSTLPARGATKRLVICQQAMCISIHAPRTGSDATRLQ